MESFPPTALRHRSACGFIDNDYFATIEYVLPVALKEFPCHNGSANNLCAPLLASPKSWKRLAKLLEFCAASTGKLDVTVSNIQNEIAISLKLSRNFRCQ